MKEHWVRAAFERFEHPLLRFAATLVGPHRAPDVVQDTFLRLCQQERAHVEPHLAAWLFTVARNRAWELRRGGQRQNPIEEGEDMKSPDSGPEQKLQKKQTTHQLVGLLDQLPDRQRQAVLLKFSAGLSYKEIAAVLDTSVSNVGFILHSAVQALRTGMSEEPRKETVS
jgi:RNA polymerase sigma-70 factor (ECF subfamily)